VFSQRRIKQMVREGREKNKSENEHFGIGGAGGACGGAAAAQGRRSGGGAQMEERRREERGSDEWAERERRMGRGGSFRRGLPIGEERIRGDS